MSLSARDGGRKDADVNFASITSLDSSGGWHVLRVAFDGTVTADAAARKVLRQFFPDDADWSGGLPPPLAEVFFENRNWGMSRALSRTWRSFIKIQSGLKLSANFIPDPEGGYVVLKAGPIANAVAVSGLPQARPMQKLESSLWLAPAPCRNIWKTCFAGSALKRAWRSLRGRRHDVPVQGLVRRDQLEPGVAVLRLLVWKKRSPFRCFKASPELVRLGVIKSVRFPLSLRNREYLQHERGSRHCQIKLICYGLSEEFQLPSCRAAWWSPSKDGSYAGDAKLRAVEDRRACLI
jgi:hypothetical protein